MKIHQFNSTLRFLIVTVLALGIFFRFVNLDRKLYWQDEASTLIRMSGYTEAEITRQIFDGHEFGVNDLRKYQRLNSEKGVIDTVQTLVMDDPQHPPLYYVMVRIWMQWFGESIAAIRSLSALISVAAFPCIYWLCLELFESSLAGWIATALVAVSPVHVLYAQEAREYILWIVTILLSSAALLRAMRLNTKLSWAIYTATISMGLYTSFFAVLIAIGHGIYVSITEGCRWSQALKVYLLASLLGFLTFTPWLILTVGNSVQANKTTAWVNEKLSLPTLVVRWITNISRSFVDFGIDAKGPLIYLVPTIFMMLVLLVLVGYSFYFIYRQAPKRVWLFIFTLTGVTALALILPDLILGGQRSVSFRYTLPCHVGIQLAVTCLLATQMTSVSIKQWQQKLWQLGMLAVISGGILSCILSSQAVIWWNKGGFSTKYERPVAQSVNQAVHPLVISGTALPRILSFSSLLKPKVRLQLALESNIPEIHDGFSDVFVYMPPFSSESSVDLPQELRDRLERRYQIEVVNPKGGLWRLKNR